MKKILALLLFATSAHATLSPINGGGGGGGVSSVSGTVPIVSSGGTTPAISIGNAAADGSTKGAASFTATDFNASSGVISLDFANAQKASGSVPGFLSSADWLTFNGKQDALGFTPINKAGDTDIATQSFGTNRTTDPTLTISSDAVGALTILPLIDRFAYNNAGTKIAMQSDKSLNRLWIYDVGSQTFSAPIVLSGLFDTTTTSNPLVWSADDSKLFVIEVGKVEEFPANLSSSTIHSFTGESLTALVFVDSFAYLASYGIGIYQIDLSDWSVVQTATTHVDQTRYFAFSPDHTKLYPASSSGSGSTFAPFAIPALTEITTVTLAPNIISITATPDGLYVLVGTDGPHVYKLQVSDFSVVADAAIGHTGNVSAASSSKFYVFSNGEANVYAYRVSDLGLSATIAVSGSNGLLSYGVSKNATQYIIPIQANPGPVAKLLINQPNDDGTGAVVQAVGDFNIPPGSAYKIGGVPTLSTPFVQDVDVNLYSFYNVGELRANTVSSVQVSNRELHNGNSTTMLSWNDTSTNPYVFANYLSVQNLKVNGSIDDGLSGVVAVACQAHASNTGCIGGTANAQFALAIDIGTTNHEGSIALNGTTNEYGIANGIGSILSGHSSTVLGDNSESASGSDHSLVGGTYGYATDWAERAWAIGYFNNKGDALDRKLLFRTNGTVGNGTFSLFLDGAGKQLTPPHNSTLACDAHFTSKTSVLGTNMSGYFERRFFASTDDTGVVFIDGVQTVGADMGNQSGLPPSNLSVNIVGGSFIDPQVTDSGSDNTFWFMQMTCNQMIAP